MQLPFERDCDLHGSNEPDVAFTGRLLAVCIATGGIRSARIAMMFNGAVSLFVISGENLGAEINLPISRGALCFKFTKIQRFLSEISHRNSSDTFEKRAGVIWPCNTLPRPLLISMSTEYEC
jgi:hypothetical protein